MDSKKLIVAFVFENIATLYQTQEIKHFFLQVLKFNIESKGFKAQFTQNTPHTFCLELQGTEEEILHFSQDLQNNIPLSLQWVFKELVVLESFSKNPINLQNAESLNFLTPLELQRISAKETDNFCNLWGDFIAYKQEKITLLDQNQKHPLTTKESLKQALQSIAKRLENGERVFIKTIFGKKEIALFNEKNPIKITDDFCFMPFCLENTKLLFKAENEELQALATLEKPIINLVPKGIFAQFFPCALVKVILPFEPYLVLLSHFLESYQGLYLLPLKEKNQNGICTFVARDFTPLHISVAKNSMILAHTFAHFSENIILKTFAKTIKLRTLERTNTLYIGNYSTQFLTYFDNGFKEPLEFSFESNLSVIVATLESLNQTTQSLLKNFTKENKALIDTLKALPKDSKISNNLLDLIGMCGVLLDLDNAQNLTQSTLKVFEAALNFAGNKGPRIDFRLERDENGKIALNTLQTLRSVMSFKLAGVDVSLLCFGILDSFAEFFANFTRDMEENYQTSGVIICGNIFLNRQFLNQFLHYLPKNTEVYPSEILEFTQ